MNSAEMQRFNIVISDASCVILLEKIGSLDILHRLYSEIFITPQVRHEFGKELPDWVTIKEVKDKALVEIFNETVDVGEASAIALAIETPMSIVMVDDLKGRKLAKKMGLNYMGVLGMLLKAKEHGIVIVIKPYIDRIKETDFHVTQALIDFVLEQAGE
jgi:predicted nucleic acid-binding protein